MRMHSDSDEYNGKPETDLLAHNHNHNYTNAQKSHTLILSVGSNSIHFVCVHSIIMYD